MAQPAIHGRLLGRPELAWGERHLTLGSRKALALLCHVLARGRAVVRAELAELLWREGSAQSLRQALSTLRRLPGASEWLDPGDPVRVRGTSDLALLETARARSDYACILELWQGPFLEGLDVRGAPAFSDWLAEQRTRLDSIYLAALLGEARRLASEGRFQEGLAYAQRFFERDDLDEEAYRTVMHLCWRAGDSDTALGWFARCRRRLADQLGVEPAEETLRLAREIEAAQAASTGDLALGAPIRVDVAPDRGGAADLDELAPAHLRVAQALTLADTAPPLQTLATVVDLDAFDVAEALDALTRAGLVTGGALADPSLRAAMRAAVPEATLRLLHLRTAEALADASAPPAQIADHYLGAAEPARALPHLLEAARDALSRYDDDEARARFRQALQCGPELRLSFEAWSGLEALARRRGDVESVSEAVEKLAALAGELQDDALLYTARLRRSEHLVDVGRPGEGGELADEAVAIARRLDDRARIDRARAAQGIALFRAGKLSEARAVVSDVSASGELEARVVALYGLGAVDGTRGYLDDAERAHAEALTLARAEGDVMWAGRLLNCLAATAERGARYAEAERCFDEALALAVRTRDPRAESVALLNLAEVRIRLGRFAAASAAAEAGTALARRHELARMAAMGVVRKATLLRSMGRPGEAAPRFDRAAAAFADCGDERNVRVARFNAEISRVEADRDAPLAPALAAVTFLQEIGLRDIAAWAWVELALIARDPAEVKAWADRALSQKDNPHVRLLAALAEQRAALLAGPNPTPSESLGRALERTRVWEAARAHALLARCAGGAAARAHEAEARAKTDAQAEGLPGHQRRYVLDRLESWLSGPP